MDEWERDYKDALDDYLSSPIDWEDVVEGSTYADLERLVELAYRSTNSEIQRDAHMLVFKNAVNHAEMYADRMELERQEDKIILRT